MPLSFQFLQNATIVPVCLTGLVLPPRICGDEALGTHWLNCCGISECPENKAGLQSNFMEGSRGYQFGQDFNFAEWVVKNWGKGPRVERETEGRGVQRQGGL
ncbi:UNVERIFIED_CONTAM: hypothetical protein K2H54_036044 [Gekko kuhli]